MTKDIFGGGAYKTAPVYLRQSQGQADIRFFPHQLLQAQLPAHTTIKSPLKAL